jgi:hypothetical protein
MARPDELTRDRKFQFVAGNLLCDSGKVDIPEGNADRRSGKLRRRLHTDAYLYVYANPKRAKGKIRHAKSKRRMNARGFHASFAAGVQLNEYSLSQDSPCSAARDARVRPAWRIRTYVRQP